MTDFCLHSNCEIYALFGNPVGHSLSPMMHNAAYRGMKLQALYVPFCVNDLADAVRGMKALGIHGASITIPFKTAIMPFLNTVDDDARIIGAVNTVANRDGVLEGINTDWIGLTHAIQSQFDIAGRTFTILGAGGAARAVVFAIIKGGGIPIVVYRSEGKAKALAIQFQCATVPFSEFHNLTGDCLINATPVGMSPHIDESPVSSRNLARYSWVMDLIYNPLETRLLRDARQAGCNTISGLDMFIYQGAEQIKFWTGIEPPLNTMRNAVRKHLEWIR